MGFRRDHVGVIVYMYCFNRVCFLVLIQEELAKIYHSLFLTKSLHSLNIKGNMLTKKWSTNSQRFKFDFFGHRLKFD